ncbi:YrdB family protein [Streptomyces rishiriensis]|uniref:YrdB family protein n=1 Tax=Streptomyces rishiriensis TaxID=68264 RepID=UPI0033D5242A
MSCSARRSPRAARPRRRRRRTPPPEGGPRRQDRTGLDETAAPAALIAAWALCGSPRARFKVRGAGRAGFELLWFGAGVGALYAAGAHGWALAFAAVCAVGKGLALRSGQ